MTVAELIEQLKTLEQDKWIRVLTETELTKDFNIERVTEDCDKPATIGYIIN